ncbi:MAG: MFS transporter [Acidimicrobiales bacterium]
MAPVLQAATGWHGSAISALLLIYGLAALGGNALGGRAADRLGPQRSIALALTSLIASLGVLSYATHLGPPAGTPIVVAVLIAWGVAGWSLTPAQSHGLVGLTPQAGPEVLSLNTSAVYLGIAAGAALGSQVLSHAGPASLGLAAAALQLVALGVVAASRRARVRTH